ncbi:MAG: hypothetical protein IJG38_11175 [Thermoguttaceae bacterium]|nr:hypothetical protein [Thermoguttaceae bacterium]
MVTGFVAWRERVNVRLAAGWGLPHASSHLPFPKNFSKGREKHLIIAELCRPEKKLTQKTFVIVSIYFS